MSANREIKLHFVGIGGIGMSGIAHVFLCRGYTVSGSDLSSKENTESLVSLGATIFPHHRPENVHGTHVVVRSTAVKDDNPEILEAHKLKIPVIPRAEMLGELMRGKTGISVAGTHGKTTTTSMLATILTYAKLDPTIVIGGKVNALGGNARLGQGDIVLAEADESDGSFLFLPSTYSIITNIDNDHLDYFESIEKIETAFVDFASKIPFFGLSILCGEDAGVKRCRRRITKPYITYGLSAEMDLYADHIRPTATGTSFEVHSRIFAAKTRNKNHETLGVFETSVPGNHNVLNSLACLGAGLSLGLSPDTLRSGLREFRGVQRRFETKWANPATQQIVIEDYGHHPTEIKATIQTARLVWPDRRLVVVFQPHRYTRTLHCHEGFLSAFHLADRVLMTDIYSAGEPPIEGVSGEQLVKDLQTVQRTGQIFEYTGPIENTFLEIKKIFSPSDVVLFMGAGSIHKLTKDFVDNLKGAAP